MRPKKLKKLKSLEWQDPMIFRSPIDYCLCLTEKAFFDELKRLKIPKDVRPSYAKNADAIIHFFSLPNSIGEIAIINLSTSVDKYSELELYALLMHEGVHLWQRICEYVGEETPSAEFEAYAIQTIALNLMKSYKKMKEEIEIQNR